MRILVVGAGATGGFYGAKLALAGRDVTFLVRGRRAAALRENGMVLRTPGGEEHIASPKLISAEELKVAAPFDLVILSVKAYGLAAAIDDFAPAIGDHTTILPILNGVLHYTALDARFGPERVVGGLCRIVGDLAPDGAIVQMTALDEIIYGARTPAQQPRVAAIDAEMRGVRFTATLAPDIHYTTWVKWTMLAGVNVINILTRGPVGAASNLREHEGIGLRFEERVVAEMFAVAEAEGARPQGADAAMIHRRLTEPDSPFESSMYRDFTRGFPVECEQILGDMVRRARAHHLDVPLTEAAFIQLRLYELART